MINLEKSLPEATQCIKSFNDFHVTYRDIEGNIRLIPDTEKNPRQVLAQFLSPVAHSIHW